MITFKYTKVFPSSFLSHLDTARAIKRAVLRANINVEKSQGFNPHMLFFFGLPIPLGTESTAEFCTVVTDMPANKFLEEFNKVAPNGIKVLNAFNVNKNPNVAKHITASKYTVDTKGIQNHKEKIDELLNKEQFIAIHKTKKGEKEKDLKPYIINYEIGKDTFNVTTKSGNENLRPDRLINAIEKALNISLNFNTITKQECYVNHEDKYITTEEWLTIKEKES